MPLDKLTSRAIIGRFYAALAQYTGADWVDLISFLQTSDQAYEEYGWLGMSPAMREWIGGRQARGFKENSITVYNKMYEATLEVLVQKELKRDKTGQLQVRINELAARAAGHWASLLTTLIINGESTVCYDAQYFFDTDHSEGDSGTQSNDLSVDISALPLPATAHGSTTAPAAEELALAAMQAVQAIMGFKDDQGEPMNDGARQFICMLPPTYMQAGLTAFSQLITPSGGTNPLVGAINRGDFNIRPVINPRLTWTTEFAVFRIDGAVKPFIRQEELPVTMEAIAEGSETEFMYDKHLYGVKASRNVAYGYWQHGCLVTLI